MKQRLSTIMTLAVLIVGGTTSAQAGELISGTAAGGQLAFYSDAACTSIISKAASGSTVYIRAIPDYGYTGIGATLSALATVGSGQAEARSAVQKPETLPFGEAIDVTTVDDARGIYRLTMPNNTNVTVSGTLATATATTVSYVDENNETQTVSAVPLDQTMTALAADQWYVVASDLTFTSGFTGTGNMCMVVPDGVTLTVGTEASPLQGDAFNGGGLCLYGQENATGKLSVNSTGNGIYLNNVYAIANLDINITCNANAIYSSFGSSSSSVIAGHSVKGNKVTLRAGSNAIYAGGHSLIVKRCDIDAVGSEGNGVYASGGNLTIEGLADGSNDLTVRSRSTAIGAGGGSAVIKYCDIDAVSTNSNGIEGNYSSSTGMGVHIEGIADGSNNVTLRCAGYGIYGGGCSVTVKYCDVEVTGATQNESGQYGFCGYSGIFEGAGSGMNIIGCASGNMVVVRSNSSGIDGAGCSVNIQNCSVDVVAKGEYGISSSSGTGITITGLSDGSSDVTVRCLNNGINAGSLPVTILNCDVEVTGLENEAGSYGYCNGAGISATGSSGLTITGAATGNRVTVRNSSSSFASLEGGARPVTIKNCTLDLANLGGRGINANGSYYKNVGIYIEGLADGTSSVTVRSATDGIFVGSQPVTILNCDVEVTGPENEAGGYGYCNGAGICATGSSGITITGAATGNRVTVRNSSSSPSLEGGGRPVTIKNCTLDLANLGGMGIDANGSDDKNAGVYIEGLADGTSSVTVRSATDGIYAGGQPVTILNCDVEVTGATQNEAGEYGFCGGSGIFAGSGSGMNIIGCASGNMVVVRSNSNGINGDGCSVTIKNCSVDVVAKGGYGIFATSGTGITIEGLADGSSNVTVRCLNNGIYAAGRAITITNCDVTVTGLYNETTGEYDCCTESGIFEGGGSGMNIIGCASGNTVTVRSNGAGGIYGDGCPVTIKNCTVDITGEGYGIYDTSPLTIDNSDITVESAKSGLYATGSANTITDSRVKVTTADTKQVGHYDAIFSPYGLTISGSQLEASAQEGNWGINLAPTYGAGTATFSWTHPTDYLNVSSCNGPVKVADGQMLTDGSSLYSGELTADEVTAIGGKTLRPGVGVTFAPAGYATYYAGSYDLVLPEGVQAFAVTDKGAVEGTLTYVTVADGDTDQNIVPAGTAVMLKTDAATDVEQTLPIVIGSGADAYSGSNLLSGSDTDTEILTATGYAFYKLAYGPDNTTFGWYWGAEDGQPFTSPAHKAWLTLPASLDARFLGLPEGDATAIAAAAQERVGKDGAWYTIGGVKLDGQPTAKGIYIKDGKKVVIK